MTPRVEILSAVVATVDIFTTSSPPLSGVCNEVEEGRKESRTNEDSKTLEAFLFLFLRVGGVFYEVEAPSKMVWWPGSFFTQAPTRGNRSARSAPLFRFWWIFLSLGFLLPLLLPPLYSPRLFLQAASFDSVSELAARNGAAGAQGNYKAERRERTRRRLSDRR